MRTLLTLSLTAVAVYVWHRLPWPDCCPCCGWESDWDDSTGLSG